MPSDHSPLISAHLPFGPAMFEEHHWCQPLNDPQWRAASKADHMRPDDPVLGIYLKGEAWALPWWIMKNHHVANIVLGKQPVLVTLCEACSSGAAFVPVVHERRLTFHLAGVLNGTHYIADVESGSSWHSFNGESFAGSLEGAVLPQLPLQQSTWAEWIEYYPTSQVLFGPQSWRAGHGSGFSPEWDAFETTLLQPLDKRLPHNTLVLGVNFTGQTRAYSLDRLTSEAGVINDQLGDTPIVVLHRPHTWTALAFDRRLDDRVMQFQRTETGVIVDEATGSLWREDGEAYAGKLAGRRLAFVPSVVEEWYVWAAYHPETELFGEDKRLQLQTAEPESPPSAIIPILADHIRTQLVPAAAEIDLTADYPIIQSGIIDSLTLFRLIAFIQKQFQVKIRPKEVMLENFATLAAIEQLVLSKQQVQP